MKEKKGTVLRVGRNSILLLHILCTHCIAPIEKTGRGLWRAEKKLYKKLKEISAYTIIYSKRHEEPLELSWDNIKC